jgi:signal peptidase I
MLRFFFPALASRSLARHWRPLLPLFGLLALLLLAACATGSADTCQSFQVPNKAMEPSLQQGQIIPIDTAAYASAKPRRGATVVVKVPTDPSQEVILRVIGLPGETVRLTETQTFINGKLLTEPFVLHRGTQQPQEVTLGPDQYFLMGDNRPASTDSREWGPVSLKDIVAQWGTDNCPAN